MKSKYMLSLMTILGLILPSTSLFAQTRIIPHLTSANGGFATKIIITNLSEEVQSYTLNPFLSSGGQLAAVNGVLGGEETVFLDASALFPSGDVSHFTIEDNDKITITLAYQDSEGANSEAHIGESNRQSPRWRVYPGSLDDVLDGVAIVNNGPIPTEVFARQMSNAGMELFRVTVDIVGENSKVLYLFEDFTRMPNTYYEIFSDQPMSITALRFANGTPGARFFWSTQAVALPKLKAENQIPQITGQDELTVVSGNDITLTLENFTVVDEDNTYPDDFFLEIIAGSNYTFDGTTVIPDQGFVGTLQVSIAVNDGIDYSDPYVAMVEVTAAQSADPRIGQKASFPSNSVYNIQGGEATIVDENTIRIDNFTYSGGGPDVRVFLGMDGNYAAGFPISGTISGNGPYENETLTLTLPPGKTLDDFNGISIWCTIFLQDFSSALFQ